MAYKNLSGTHLGAVSFRSRLLYIIHEMVFQNILYITTIKENNNIHIYMRVYTSKTSKDKGGIVRDKKR